MADEFDALIRARIEVLQAEDPAKALKLEGAFTRLKEAEAKLQEMCKDDGLRESRMRAYGVID
jgi:hypothetical protein